MGGMWGMGKAVARWCGRGDDVGRAMTRSGSGSDGEIVGGMKTGPEPAGQRTDYLGEGNEDVCWLWRARGCISGGRDPGRRLFSCVLACWGCKAVGFG
jgi:hypothetical protein